ncbi:GAF domain-containing protein [Amnibacterium kyonggiense]|uniref:GAF domain-containing protein n=1 Tax=Amnibacterium kyonggiense TaxID=595671 RepID=A0A4V3EB21_9MICO|nr:GAF domain-containing protein [Amnibacterium kyonggiense]
MWGTRVRIGSVTLLDVIDQRGPRALIRRPAELLYAAMHNRRRTLARPVDLPWVRTGNGDALRFLFIGSGLAHGWGVSSHRSAPTGELARAIRAISGTACEVELVGDEAMSAATALDWLAGRADTTFHGAVVSIGANDAMRLTPVADWGARLVNLLNAVQTGLPKGAPVILVGIPDVHVPNRVRSMNPLALRHARRLDKVAHRLASVRADVTFLPAPRLGRYAGLRPNSDLYAAFTLPIAAAVASAIRESRIAPSPFVRAERFDRPEVRAIVESPRAEDVGELHDLVVRAAAEFHVSEAMVSLLDGDRAWHVATTGAAPVAMPRALSYCETVVATGEELVVEDAKRDARFAENAFLDLVHAPFYAGVPIHAEDGTVIGSMCLNNGFPRAAESVDLERLREYAVRAEAVIRRATSAAGWLDAALVG